MKKNILVAALMLLCFLAVKNVNAKCSDYNNYHCLHSTNSGYLWYTNDGSPCCTITINEGDTLEVDYGLVYGMYCPYHFDSKLSFSTSGNYSYNNDGHIYRFIVIVIPVTGITENDGTISFRCFPNPTSSEVTINFGKASRYTVQLSNTLGEMLEQTQTNSFSLSLNLSTKPKGIYFITVTDEQGNKVVRKVVKM